jgi:hypothetical protein
LGKSLPRLSQRVWRGQLSILFPWLEEVRTLILSNGAKKLSKARVSDTLGQGLKVDDFEFVHIAFALKSIEAPQPLVNAAHTLRLARNELAHCRPIGFADFKAAEGAAIALCEGLTT